MEEARGIIRTIATAQDPTLVRCFRGHEKTVNSVAFCPEMKQVASASSDGIVHVWSFKPQLRPFKFVGHIGAVNDIVFTANSSKIISCGDDRQIKFWKNSVKSRPTSIKAHSGPVLGLALSEEASSKFLVSCSTDKTLKMWTLDGKFKQSYLGHTNWVRECQVAHDHRVMLSCSDDRTVKLWDLQTAKAAVSFSDHKDAVYTAKFSPDGTCVAGGCIDGTIKLWDVRNNKLIQHYNAHNGPINKLDFHPFGYHMTSVSDDGKIKVWELKHGRLGWTLYGHNGQIKALDFSKRGDYFVTGAEDSLVMIWRSNYDEGLVMPSRAEQINYIQKGKDTLQPMLRSNKPIKSGDIHKGVARFGGAGQEFGEEFVRRKDIQNDSERMNIDPRKKNIAQIMSSGLEKLVNQLDFVTRTIGSLEERITQHQRTVQGLFEHPKVADYLSMLEESEKMKPEIYNSVWEAFKNAQHDAAGLARTAQRLNDPDLEDIAADFKSLNKNLSDKKLPTMGVLEDDRALRFKEELEIEEVAFNEQELEPDQQPNAEF